LQGGEEPCKLPGYLDVASDCVGGTSRAALKLYRETRGPGASDDLSIETLLAELLAAAARLPAQ